MAQLGNIFDAEAIEPSVQYEAIPPGRYLAYAVESEMKENKSQTGEYLQIVFEIIEGDYKGRKVFERLNIVNQSEKAQEIAQRALSSLCRAVNVMKLKDSEQLHGKKVELDLIIEAGDGKYAPSNRIKGYYAAGGSAPQAAAPKAAAPSLGSKPAWKK
ncbi:MAG: hypothetical protein BWZ03_00124 [bacterium ADurb.BinA186]|nr:MAG: hypothetical protein BWZ03_00124 [bacterium ADurb.BinA186]